MRETMSKAMAKAPRVAHVSRAFRANSGFRTDHLWNCSLLRRIAKDETLHMAFYRDVVKAHLDLDPGYLRPLAAVMLRFEMPWSGAVLRDFEERRALLAARGVFRLSDYLDEVVQPLWSYWGLDGRTLHQEETQWALVQLRRYRAALRKFARSEAGPADDATSSGDAPGPVA